MKNVVASFLLLWELALNIAKNNSVSLRQRYLSSIISAMNYSQIFSYRDSILATEIKNILVEETTFLSV